MLLQLVGRFARNGQTLNLLLAGMLVVCAFGASHTRADVVTEWNAIMEAAVTAPPSNPVIQTRWGAIVQLAVFEAVNSITGEYERFAIALAPARRSPGVPPS